MERVHSRCKNPVESYLHVKRHLGQCICGGHCTSLLQWFRHFVTISMYFQSHKPSDFPDFKFNMISFHHPIHTAFPFTTSPLDRSRNLETVAESLYALTYPKHKRYSKHIHRESDKCREYFCGVTKFGRIQTVQTSGNDQHIQASQWPGHLVRGSNKWPVLTTKKNSKTATSHDAD